MQEPIRQVSAEYLQSLIEKSRVSSRRRAPTPLHPDEYAGPQALINPMQPDSYAAPHRHKEDEIWVPIKGLVKVCLFEESGAPLLGINLSNEQIAYYSVKGGTYHTVFAIEPDSVFLNITQGPFNPGAPKEFPVWAPRENGDPSWIAQYIKELRMKFN